MRWLRAPRRLPVRRRTLALTLLSGAALLGACAEDSPPRGPCVPEDVLVLASDFASSRVGGARADGAATLVGGVDLYKDPALATSQGRAFVVARDNDSVLELSSQCGLPAGTRPWSLVAGERPGSKNPQDVAVAPDGTLWVPNFLRPTVDHVARDGALLPPIALAPFDEDGNPQASSAFTEGNALFVVLERLDDRAIYASTRPSQVARFDATTGAFAELLVLPARNPFGIARRDTAAAGTYWLSSAGNFDAADDGDAGIVRLTTSPLAATLIVPEASLGGSVVEAVGAGPCGAAIVAGSEKDVNPTRLVAFDPATGAVRELLPPTSGFDYYGITFTGTGPSTALWIGDRRARDGRYALHRFTVGANCTYTATPDVFVDQKPVALRPPV